jgi:hypothetical protein
VAASIFGGGITVALSSVSWGFLFASTSATRTWTAAGAVALLWVLARPLWRGIGPRFVARTIVLAYSSLLFLGVAAVEQLWLWKRAGWPIAVQARLPDQSLIRHAFWLALLGGLALAAGAALAARRGKEAQRALTSGWDDLLPGASLLAGVGLIGALVVIAKTHQLVLLAHNVDAARFTQNSGVGYASLLEYELLLAVCVAAGALVQGVRARGYALALTAAGACVLLVVRAERTPVVFAVLTTGFVYVFGDRKFKRLSVVVVGVLLAAGSIALGTHRLSSTGVAVGQRGALVHAAYDLAPEFREQAFVYYVYPTRSPFLQGKAIDSDAAALLPSAVLRTVGIDKRSVYGDISHKYSATMSLLGLYPAGIAPLRVGIAGEMWADFGWAGLIGGLFILGVLAGLVTRVDPSMPLGAMRKAVAASSLMFAIITPIGALLPLVLMVTVPLWLLSGITIARGVRSKDGKATSVRTATRLPDRV